ncbi:hypothetical protein AB6A40_007349 [Gnathostoma spinigerum]|uniref:Uncharacterized protein n=1 Tax=Gnathostoma spinigerum TaxID=75299 RepID=A0ABD6EWK3_9BILA
MTSSPLSITLILHFVVLSSDAVLFSVKCDNHPELLSNWSQCVIPNGDLADAISGFLRDVKDHGCKLPPRKVVRFGLSFLKNHTSAYLDHPLYKRVPSANCGMCGRRVRCCRRSKSFLAQSYVSEVCSGYTEPCMLEPLKQKDIDELTVMYPKAEAPIDGCNVSSYLKAELAILSQGPAFRFVEPLLCQIVGTKFPSVGCVRRGDKCACCCSPYRPTNDSRCVLDETFVNEFTCH